MELKWGPDGRAGTPREAGRGDFDGRSSLDRKVLLGFFSSPRPAFSASPPAPHPPAPAP